MKFANFLLSDGFPFYILVVADIITPEKRGRLSVAQRRRIRKKKRVSPLRRAGKLAYRILVVLSAIIVVLYCAYRLASKKPTQAPEP